MTSLRAIRTRIKSVENTRQITKSMKMVAAAKLRRTQGAFATLRAFAEESGSLLREASAANALTAENPYLLEHTSRRKVCYVLLVGNRGLCGTYNQALLRYCEKLVKERTVDRSETEAGEKTVPSSGSDSERIPDRAAESSEGTAETPEISLLVCGRWGRDQIAASGIPVRETLDIGDTPGREEALAFTEKLKQLYRDGEADEVVLVYQQYQSVLSQSPGSRTLLPLQIQNGGDGADKEGGCRTGSEAEAVPVKTEFIFEPDRESIVNALLDMYLTNTVHAVLLEARTGEHSARMTAMTAASDNTEELISKLTLELNHARQAAITTEITEIASGAEALRNSQAGG